MRIFRKSVPLLICTILLAAGLGGCAGAGWGTLEDILGPGGIYGTGREVYGEVRGIDARRQEIHLSTGWGRVERLRYDRRTEVVYGRRRYQVRHLERGDLVVAQTEPVRRGIRYARRIDIERNAWDRRGRDRRR